MSPITHPPIDVERAAAALDGAPIGHTIHYSVSLPTTMQVARLWAADRTPRSGALALAEEQTAGRGRLERRWEAPPRTSLLVSLLIREEQAPREPGRLPMIAGLALLDAIAHVAPDAGAGLKWPNDVLLGDDPDSARKVAGILIESVMRGGRVESAVIGMGVNVNQSHEELPVVEPPALLPTSLALAAGHALDRTELLIALCRAFAFHLSEPDDSIVARWRSRLWTLGRPVIAHLPAGDRLEGLAVDVTPVGGLVIETDDGRREVVDAGDVSLRGAAPAA